MRIPLLRSLLLAVVSLGALAVPAGAVEVGVNQTPGQTMNVVEGAKGLGAGWIRVWGSWEQAEPGRGSFDPRVIAGMNDTVNAAKARGLKVLMVIHRSPGWAARGGKGGPYPPADPAFFGTAMGELARRVPGADAWELWNEQDAPQFFAGAPNPSLYAAMVKSAHSAIKAVQPADTVVLGGLVGNDADFVEALYRHGAQGSFDAVAVHTDTACLTDGPDMSYRDEQGRIGRYTFTGYREVHSVMAAHGDGAKPIWMTELGWNTQSTAPGSCNVGAKAGTKPLGVSEADQARHLAAAFGCLAADPVIGVAFWFGMQDIRAASVGGYGLYRLNGSAKPSVAAFKNLADGIAPKYCGGVTDTAGPEIRIGKPTDGKVFVDMIGIDVVATDTYGGAGIRRIEMWADGKFVRTFGDGRARISRWWPSRYWKRGRHSLTFKASDEAGNHASTTILVKKVRRLPKTRTASALVLEQLDPSNVRATGKVSVVGAAKPRVRGKAHVVFQQWVERAEPGWVTRHKTTAAKATRGVLVTRSLEPGRWRAILRYTGHKRFKPSRSAPVEVLAA